MADSFEQQNRVVRIYDRSQSDTQRVLDSAWRSDYQTDVKDGRRELTNVKHLYGWNYFVAAGGGASESRWIEFDQPVTNPIHLNVVSAGFVSSTPTTYPPENNSLGGAFASFAGLSSTGFSARITNRGGGNLATNTAYILSWDLTYQVK